MTDYRQHYRDKTVLVTGGAGAIGSNLCSNLAELGARIICLDDLSASMSWNVPSSSTITFVQGDILDERTIKEAFSKRPQIVFHLAAFFANQNSVDHPERDLMVNGLGTLRLLQCSIAAEVERFVYASSSSIYGSEAPLPIREETISVNLSTPYQITKLLGELYCNYYYSHYGLKVVKPRLFNSYGPGELPGQYRNVIPNFIYQAMKGGPLTITGTGEEKWVGTAPPMAGLLRLVCAIPPAEPDLRLSPHPALHQMSQTRGSGRSAFPPSSSGSYIPSPA